MGKSKITLYYDIVSPFGYFGYYTLRNNPLFSECEKTYIPIFLGGLMKACENRPPIQIKNKDKWINLERLRWAEQFDIPMAKGLPEGFPVLTLQTQRALTALSILSPTHLLTATDALYASFFTELNAQIANPDVFLPIIAKALKKSTSTTTSDSSKIDELIEKIKQTMNSAETKEQLNKNTNLAFKDGAFGLPWFQCENAKGKKEGFWGFDHLGQVVRFLGLDQDGNEGFGNKKLKGML